jgi:diguanylate cyclase (GGDEF)-like protein
MPQSNQPTPQFPSTASTGLQLLIVEDVPEDVELILLALTSAGITYQYDLVASLEHCQACLRDRPYDAILSDYRLPGVRAPEVLQAVQTYQPMTPFILITGSLGEEAAVDCIKAGMTDYVLKDSLYRLPTVLKRALAEATLRRQKQAAIAQLEQQAWRESVVNQIVQAMRETLVLDEVMQTLVDQLHETLKVDNCAILRPMADDRMVIQTISRQSQRLHPYLGKTCHLWPQHQADWFQGQPQFVLDVGNQGLHPAADAFLQALETRTLMVTNLQYGNHCYGLLMLHQCHPQRSWSPSECSLVQAVAEQGAIAIYQAELYEQAQRELAQRRRMEDQLRHDAFHDTLTGLPNRALFLDRLNHAIQISQRHRSLVHEPAFQARSFAVLFLDLDNFRMVNDSLGHEAGDFLLQVVADRLTHCMRTGDTLARVSGDEFAILLEDITTIDDVLHTVDTIHSALKVPMLIEAQEVFASTCIGVVLDTHDYQEAAQVLRDADTAVYQAKTKGRSQYRVFNESMYTQVKQRLHLENGLRQALSRHELVVFYQPILHLSTQSICGFEALVRWQDPKRGLRPPNEFIPVAEQTGLIVPLGQWVLETACRQLARWSQHWPEADGLHMAVNLSAQQFAQPHLITSVDQALMTTGLSGRHLRLEITEGTLLANEEIAFHTLHSIRQREIQVAMDDFGTGYSSLSYLLRFPKDVLKIDKSFVSQLEDNLEHQEIIKTILHLGRNLGLEVVAEGIETPQQFKFLLRYGCSYGQGYWFYPPLTVTQVEGLLDKNFSQYA